MAVCYESEMFSRTYYKYALQIVANAARNANIQGFESISGADSKLLINVSSPDDNKQNIPSIQIFL
jgi:hypothetical protein